MKARNWLNNNSAMVTILAVVVLILSLGFIIISSRQPTYTPRIYDVYYYDLDTKTLFVDKSNKFAPIQSPSGKVNGARAYVYTCGECSDTNSLFVGYLEMYTKEAKEFLENPTPPSPDDTGSYPDHYEEGRRIRAESDAARWFNANSSEAFQVTEAVHVRCNGQPAKPCNPGDK